MVKGELSQRFFEIVDFGCTREALDLDSDLLIVLVRCQQPLGSEINEEILGSPA